MKLDNDSLERILRGGRLSDADLARGLDVVIRRTSRRRRAGIWVSVAVAGAAMIGLLFLVPSRLLPRNVQQGEAGTRSKGMASGPDLAVHCTSGSLASCGRGSRLMFQVGRRSEPVYLVAFAEKDGKRVVYFPTATGTVPRVAAGPASVLPESVVIGPEHASGEHVLHIMLVALPGDVPRALAGASGPHHVRLKLRVVP